MVQVLIPLLLVHLFAAPGAAAPRRAPPAPPPPRPRPPGWVAVVDHPFLPLRPGTVYVYSSKAGGGSDVDTVTVTRETRIVDGIPAVVVRDRAYHAGALTEDTADWYAQDRDGNVWYLGEDTREYRNGRLASTAGSWEAGKYGAEPGIIMEAKPRVGETYRQEHRRGVAEDNARVLSLDETVTVPYGVFTGCLETEEWSPLEPGVREHKYYGRGIGLLLARTVAGGNEELVLVKVLAP